MSSLPAGTPDPAALARVVADLDRCMHGRHRGDPCAGWHPYKRGAGCPGGVSLGNPHMQPGHVIGYDRAGNPYTVPTGRGRLTDPAAWRQLAVTDPAAQSYPPASGLPA
jgi:hypothetical protein